MLQYRPMAGAKQRRGSHVPPSKRAPPKGTPGKDLHVKRPAMGGTRAWSIAVIKRDKVCRECGSDDRLRAHRIKPTDTFPHLALDVGNGRALCASCSNRAYREAKVRNQGKPRRATLEKTIELLTREIEDLRAANELLRTKPGTVLPLDYVMSTLNDPKAEKADKQWAASQGLPFMHRRMPIAIEGGTPDKVLRMATHDQLRLLTQEQFDAIKLASGAILKAIPSRQEVMAEIASQLLEHEQEEDKRGP